MLDRLSTTIRERLIALVTNILADQPLARPDRIVVGLHEAGMTSLDTVKLVLGIESEFGVAIDGDDFDSANFETLDALELLVRRLSD